MIRAYSNQSQFWMLKPNIKQFMLKFAQVIKKVVSSINNKFVNNLTQPLLLVFPKLVLKQS